MINASGLKIKDPQKASILFLALWSVFLLATLAIILSYPIRQKMMLVQRLDERDSLRLIAEAGIKRTIAYIRSKKDEPVFSLDEKSDIGQDAFKGISVGEGTCDIYNIYFDKFSGQERKSWGVRDEESKININTADLHVLKRLFQFLLNADDFKSQEMAACIVDWRDGDSMLSLPIGSAEDSDYRALSYSYEAKDSSFQVLDEALLVQGFSQQDFEKIKDYITVYGNGRVNINTASGAVLLALGLNQETVEKILEFRRGQDKIEGTQDDFLISSPDQIKQVGGLNAVEAAKLEAAIDNYLTASSDTFMIKGIATLGNKKRTAEVVCVADREGQILYWKEF